jgi:hypothetical protein
MVGNMSKNVYRVQIDKTAPIAGTLTMKLGDSEGNEYINNTWTEESVYISVNSGEDRKPGSGHDITTYRINDGEESTEEQLLTEPGEYTIVVTTKDKVGNIETSEYNVKIRKVESIVVTKNPEKFIYNAHEEFDANGMIVSIKYDNGDVEETTEYTIINGEQLTCQSPSIKIQYNQNPEIYTELTLNVEHDMDEATCTEDAKCKVDGCTYIKEGSKLGHSVTNYVLNNDATCTEDGTKTGKCDRCDGTETITAEGSALGHEYETRVVEPTCTTQGYTMHQCTRCQDSYEDTYTEALKHSFTNYVSNNDATCTEDGTKTAKCDRCDETHIVTDEGSKIPHDYENEECKMCGQKELKAEITSEQYIIQDLYISKIQPKTTIKEFKERIETNSKEVKVYNNGEEIQEDDKIIKTGMQIEIEFAEKTKTFTLAVDGDVNGDGKADFKDIVSMNKHKLNKNKLNEVELIAGDVNSDNKVDFKDIVKVNKYRLNKITQLFEML